MRYWWSKLREEGTMQVKMSQVNKLNLSQGLGRNQKIRAQLQIWDWDPHHQILLLMWKLLSKAKRKKKVKMIINQGISRSFKASINKSNSNGINRLMFSLLKVQMNILWPHQWCTFHQPLISQRRLDILYPPLIITQQWLTFFLLKSFRVHMTHRNEDLTRCSPLQQVAALLKALKKP
jgi:hypothetical protein